MADIHLLLSRLQILWSNYSSGREFLGSGAISEAGHRLAGDVDAKRAEYRSNKQQ